ncbi:MAG TPA: DoxX family protein [Gemmatimonadaceae bacterium]|nr:DoxX family protein [Gemmatimonadaceae bacterium]
MTLLYVGANVLSAGVFLCFGLWCLFGGGMKEDFDRFGMSRLRILTGVLEVLGAIGLMAGQFVPGLAILSGGGLALLMTLGLLTRVRQRDSLVQMVPAALLIVVNGYIAIHAWRTAG